MTMVTSTEHGTYERPKENDVLSLLYAKKLATSSPNHRMCQKPPGLFLVQAMSDTTCFNDEEKDDCCIHKSGLCRVEGSCLAVHKDMFSYFSWNRQAPDFYWIMVPS